MKLAEVQQLLQGEVITSFDGVDPDITSCMGTDMMSDVLAFAEPGALLVTGLTNSQSVRTAGIADAAGIVYVRGKSPDEQAVNLAEKLRIPVLSTKHGMFETCAILCNAGLKGVC
ncbi:MAG: transcriptional regulator [Candidatus Eisenbacteria bacterium]|nr:transcriptional regulator [Candidatus Eisenbacteria bacterium]